MVESGSCESCRKRLVEPRLESLGEVKKMTQDWQSGVGRASKHTWRCDMFVASPLHLTRNDAMRSYSHTRTTVYGVTYPMQPG